jgi:hypothetical protein
MLMPLVTNDDERRRSPSGKYDKPESAVSAVVGHTCVSFGIYITRGLTTALANRTDETCKSSAHLFETLTDPKVAFSGSPSECAWTKSTDLIHPSLRQAYASSSMNETDANGSPKAPPKSLWDLLALPTPPTSHLGFPRERLRRFGVAMQAAGNVHPVIEVLQG